VDWGLFSLSSNAGGRLVQQPADAHEATWPARAPSWLHFRLHYFQLAVEATRGARRPPWRDLLGRDAEFYRRRRHDRARFYFNSQRHLLLVRTLLAMVAVDEPGKALALEYTSLSDIYHGLGATRTALALGVPVGALVSLLGVSRSWDASVLATVLVGAVAAGFYLAAHVNRAEVLRRLVGTAYLGLTYVLDAQAKASEGRTVA
jgi:hypothetical protein